MQLRCLDCILQHLQLNRIHQSDTVMVISPFPKCQTLRAGACFGTIIFRYERFGVMCSSHGADHRFPGMLQFEIVTVSKPLIFPVMPYLQDELPLMQSAGIPQVVCSRIIILSLISPFSI